MLLRDDIETRSSLPSYHLRLAEVVTLFLQLGVTAQLASTALIDPITIIIMPACLILLLRFRINSTWLIAAGALIGIAHTLP